MSRGRRQRPERRASDSARPIELKVEYKRLNTFFADYTKNISRGGTFIKTSKPLPVGTEFLFKLFVPGRGEPLTIHGEVQRIVSGTDVDGDGTRTKAWPSVLSTAKAIRKPKSPASSKA